MNENNEKRVPNFMLIMGSDESQTLVNLDQLRAIDQIRDGHCRLMFSETFVMTITGKGADQLIGLLLVESTSIDGTPIIEMYKKTLEKKESV